MEALEREVSLTPLCDPISPPTLMHDFRSWYQRHRLLAAFGLGVAMIFIQMNSTAYLDVKRGLAAGKTPTQIEESWRGTRERVFGGQLVDQFYKYGRALAYSQSANQK